MVWQVGGRTLAALCPGHWHETRPYAGVDGGGGWVQGDASRSGGWLGEGVADMTRGGIGAVVAGDASPLRGGGGRRGVRAVVAGLM